MGYTRIQLRHDASNRWALSNPVLALGEAGVEIDTRKLKIGDGVTGWKELPYFEGDGGVVAWSDIAGVLSSNAALLAALNNKQSISEKGEANGYAPLDGDGRVPVANVPNAVERVSNKGALGGYAPLGEDGAVPWANLPEGIEKTANRGASEGYAGLGEDGKLLELNIPTTVERTTNRGVAGGYAPLGNDRLIPEEYLPEYVYTGGGGDIPRGVIVMWSGAIVDIPSGWALCDGTRGTPNLLDRFIVSVATAENNPGATGGTNSQRLTEAQLPAHTHAMGDHTHDIDHTHSIGSHTHTMSHTHNIGSHTHTMSHSHSGSTGSVGNHDHNAQPNGTWVLGCKDGWTVVPSYVNPVSGAGCPKSHGTIFSEIKTGLSGSHSHSVTVSTYSGSTGSASASTGGASTSSTGGASGSTGSASRSASGGSGSVATAETGSNATFDNRPAYYALALIMKL